MFANQKTILISGGSRGLGAAMVADSLEHGHRVITFSRRASDDLKRLGDAFGERLVWEALDATDTDAVTHFVKRMIADHGRIDALVNNAAVSLEQLFPLTSPEAVERTLTINLTACMVLTQLVSRNMLAHSAGNIINIGSILGSRGYKGTAVYSATKAALEGFTRSLARELGSRGIRVNCIAPGFIETDMTEGLDPKQRRQIERRTPLGRLGRVEDVLGLLRFLLSEDAAFMTGQVLVVDGGLTC
ncbi:SDR family NAD(P)-dependent oxidoreductase [Acanthopleuribacter pedis]|uniref:SDR family oxidoreductase n=1 Tax=Acanthopleuribacter pedis TaxID=442870 RepID=A0A8J7Q8G8_9BACT|nr:SDR family oxidoreductase [Acanthopleuribacter pedis]MBO1319359.1 SDR family oxidoreductase [Acanthopleuribacter pedis]